MHEDPLRSRLDVGRWDRLRPRSPVAVVDGGLTVVDPGTCTALARWA